MRAVILAGGRGTRLAPFTTIVPKPLMPIGSIPILEIVMRQLRHFGFRRVTLAVGYLSELIRAYVDSNRTRFEGLEIDFAHEVEPTGTAGPLAGIEGLDETFLVMNGDILTTVDYAALVEHHRHSEATLTIAACQKPVQVDLGVIRVDGAGLVTGYDEKPRLSYLVSMGIYVYEPEATRLIAPGEHLDFPDLVHRLIGEGRRVATYAWSGYWLDIGRPEDFQAAVAAFADHPGDFHVD